MHAMKIRTFFVTFFSTVTLLGAAKAQTVDETIGYLNQYASNVKRETSIFSYSTRDNPIRFRAPSTLVSSSVMCELTGNRICADFEDAVDLTLIDSIAIYSPNNVRMVCAQTVGSCVTFRNLRDGGVGSTSGANINCSGPATCERMKKALEHLKSLVGDDPFAQ